MQYKRGKDGKFAGSVGDGKARVPTAAHSAGATDPATVLPAGTGDYSSVYDRLRQVMGRPVARWTDGKNAEDVQSVRSALAGGATSAALAFAMFSDGRLGAATATTMVAGSVGVASMNVRKNRRGREMAAHAARFDAQHPGVYTVMSRGASREAGGNGFGKYEQSSEQFFDDNVRGPVAAELARRPLRADEGLMVVVKQREDGSVRLQYVPVPRHDSAPAST